VSAIAPCLEEVQLNGDVGLLENRHCHILADTMSDGDAYCMPNQIGNFDFLIRIIDMAGGKRFKNWKIAGRF
jgi:hypothetical protein